MKKLNAIYRTPSDTDAFLIHYREKHLDYTDKQLRGRRDVLPFGAPLLDLRAGIKSADGRWNASMWGQNVTNEYYVMSVGHLQDVVSRSVGMPVTYGISLGWRY
jgi:outer membrane receptor protein involved in Fe transport